MQSAIGRHFDNTLQKRYVALGVGVVVVSTDSLICFLQYAESTRLSLALVGFATFVFLTDGDLRSLGLSLRPKQGWTRWFWISLKISCIVAVCVIVGLSAWHLLGKTLKIHNTNPDDFVHRFLHMCVVAPVLEETIYRVIVCMPLVSLIGCWKTIAINGVLFAALHFVYGNPSPENLVAGFLFAWVYLKSETILLPLLLHSLGNFVALCFQVAAWYYLHPAA